MPPPSLGLDLTSPIDNMDPASALELVNCFPAANTTSVRLGYVEFASLPHTTPIGFMAELPRPNNTSQLIVSNNTQLYSISSLGVVTNISKAGGYTNGGWNHEIFANNIYLCNGVNNAQVYTGTSTAADLNATFSGGGSTLDKLINVNSYRERLYFIEKDTFKVWFHDTARAVFTTAGSVLKSYDFQYIMKRGGYLLFTATYTNQTAQTSDDYFMAVSSEGEIVLFSGYSPDDTEWRPVAHFFIGKPLGPKAYIRVNHDVWILTTQGVVPVSVLFQADPEQAINVISEKVNPLITQYANMTGFTNLWHGFFWPGGRRVYISIPDSDASAFFLVYSMDRKAWTVFKLATDTDAYRSCKFMNLPFYGSHTGKIYKGETGYADNVTSTSTGSPINFDGRLAFSFYNTRGNYKTFKDMRPLIKTRRGVSLGLGLDTDFKRQDNLGQITTPVANFTAWGSQWGIGAGTLNPTTGLPMATFYQPWSSDIDYIYDRYATLGQGHCAAIRFSGSIKGSPLEIYGFEIRYIIGGQV